MHPVLLSVGFIKIYSYGLFLSIAFLISLFYLKRKAVDEGIKVKDLIDLSLSGLIAGIIGARLLYVLDNYQYYLNEPLEIILLNKGGLIFYGGLLLGSLASVIFIKKRRLPLGKITDLLAPCLALGESMTRIGCFMAGCCYGKPTSLPWGVRFPVDSLACSHYGHKVLHPTQLYSFLALLVVFIFLNWKLKHKLFEGEVFIWYFISYSTVRFILEFFRGDNLAFIFSLTMAQSLGILLFICSLFFWLMLKNRSKTLI
ncbi:prolipoprotein diacylglyceryl transferase [bacterium]|nr:prolipoprotein diacylglyceryl transferase [bacterium]